MVYLIQPRFFSEIAANYLGVVIDSAIISADGHFAFNQLSETANNALLQMTIQKAEVASQTRLVMISLQKQIICLWYIHRINPLLLMQMLLHFNQPLHSRIHH